MGDLLWQDVARHMLTCVRDSDTVARIGGDAFVVLLRKVADEWYALAVAEKICASLKQLFLLAGHALGISCCIGIAIYPQHGEDNVPLSGNASRAMYQAKENERNQVLMYQAPLA